MTEHERKILASRLSYIHLDRSGGGTAFALRSALCVIQGANTSNAITSLITIPMSDGFMMGLIPLEWHRRRRNTKWLFAGVLLPCMVVLCKYMSTLT